MHSNSHKMFCKFPDLSKQDIKENEFHIGFGMDGVKDYEVLNQITVVKDPEFYYFTEPGNVRNFYVYNTALRILVKKLYVLPSACSRQSQLHGLTLVALQFCLTFWLPL